MYQLELRDVSKAYGDVAAVNGVSLGVGAGSCMALLGPSGCGKTTLLRLVAGLLTPDAGSVHFDGRNITDLPAHERKFGFVFQNYALFPHMTVSENVGYGLRLRGIAQQERRDRVHDALARVGLHGVEKRYPAQLSGGQQQRVALARALVIEPQLLLLDEPLGALDKKLREEMQVELRQLQQKLGITTIFVTHDQEEALTLSDQVAVIRNGQVLQAGSPQEVYDHPKDWFVSSFVGTTNFVPGRIVKVDGEEVVVQVGEARVRARAGATVPVLGDAVQVAVRPEKLHLTAEDGPSRLSGTVSSAIFQGHRVIVVFRTLDGIELQVFAHPGEPLLPPGAHATVWWEAHDAIVFGPHAKTPKGEV